MKNLLEFIVKSLVDKPEEVKIDSSEQGERTILSFTVNPDDMGKIIGKGGKIIKAIRTLVRTKAIKDSQRVDVSLQEKT